MPQLYPPPINPSQPASNLAITDGITTVDPVSTLTVSGATVTDDGSQSATLTVQGGGGGSVINSSKPLAFQYEAEDFSDGVPTGSNLVVEGTVPIGTGKVGNAFSFSGNSSNRLKLPNSSEAAYGNKSYFVAAWVNPSVSQFQAIIAKEEFNSGRRTFFLGLNPDGTIRVRLGDGTTTAFFGLDSLATVPTGIWTHILAVHDASTDQIAIYINGASDVDGNYAGTISNISDPLLSSHFIGVRHLGSSFDNPFNGLIDQLIKGDFIPTPQEISALYNSGDGVADAQSVFVSSSSGGNSATFSKVLDISFSQNTNFSQASSILAPAIFDQENLDTHNVYDPTTGLITFPETTTLFVSYNLRGVSSGSGRFISRFVEDGGTVGILETTNEISVTSSTFHTLSFYGEVTFQGGVGYALNTLKTFSQVYTTLADECYLRIYDTISSSPTAPSEGSFTLTDTDAINYFENHATLASTHEKLITENLVTRLKDFGLWPKVEFLWVNLGDSPTNVLIPLKGSAATSSRSIVNADLEASGGLNPNGSFVTLNFPALSSNTSYHLGWAKLPHADSTTGGVFGQIHYKDTSVELSGLKIETIDNQNGFWYAPGVVFAVSGSTIRSYEAGGFVGTTNGTTRLAAKSTASTFSLSNSPVAINTGQLRIGLPAASSSKQPAFCAGQHLSLLEMMMLQILLEEYATSSIGNTIGGAAATQTTLIRADSTSPPAGDPNAIWIVQDLAAIAYWDAAANGGSGAWIDSSGNTL